MVSAKICFIGQRIYYNHYRPAIAVRDDMLNSCELNFKNKDKVHGGEEIESDIFFFREDLVVNYLYVGKFFLMYEGPKIVGQGKITFV
ncbi:hypothetical protein [Viscerimonas tarda]